MMKYAILFRDGTLSTQKDDPSIFEHRWKFALSIPGSKIVGVGVKIIPLKKITQWVPE